MAQRGFEECYGKCGLLSGAWAGFSRSKANGSLTLWKDVVIGSKETARASVYHASGRGISHWRGLDIPFDLSLSCNLVSSYLMLDKLHTSNQYKNATKYDCQFGYCDPKSLHAFLASDSCFVRGYTPGMSNVSSGQPNVIVKWGDAAGVVKLVRLSHAADGVGDGTGVGVGVGEGESGDSSSKADAFSAESRSMRKMWTSWLAVHFDTMGLVAEGGQVGGGAAWGTKADVSSSSDVGVGGDGTKAQLLSEVESMSMAHGTADVAVAPSGSARASSAAAILPPPPPPPSSTAAVSAAAVAAAAAASASDIPEADMCKLCYSAAIDTVILPCGHFAVCMDCGIHLDVCPFDRCSIEKLQPIYRV